MELVFLGTGGAWGLPEIRCDCLICQEMGKKGEKRDRTSLLLSGDETLLVDCGPDARQQLARHHVERPAAVLISHEHGDHYMGLDELFVYKRIAPKGTFSPIPVYLTELSWAVIRDRFQYLHDLGVIEPKFLSPGQEISVGAFRVFPFKTNHGAFSNGSVGFMIRFADAGGKQIRLVYTSDFKDLPVVPPVILDADYLVIQSFWLNEPAENRPSHMSFQRALDYIDLLRPRKGTFLVHIGDADTVPGDPANAMTKKYEPRDPMRPPAGGVPYPIPRCQAQWEAVVARILTDRGISRKVTVAYDDMRVPLR
jgi:phosphoribosyl 1,2-cyclic phosphate phosphodiesterase